MTGLPSHLTALGQVVLAACANRNLMIATAESCTGGLIAACITAIPGCSQWMDCGFVTYSNAAKERMLGVPADMLARHGAVSEAVARAMAEGALTHSGAAVSVAVTGIAGPGGGTPDKPVGLVHIAAARRFMTTLHARRVFPGNRDDIREATVAVALEMLLRRTDPD